MRNRAYIDHTTEEISWTFNDFILGFLMIVLMMASMFAFLSNSVVVDSFINQCEDPEDPDCGTGNTLFGGRQKGANSDKIVKTAPDQNDSEFVKKWAGIGDIGGNTEVGFGSPKLNPQKANIVFEILPSGDVQYRGEVVTIEEMHKLISAVSLEKGVYLEAIVHSGTPFEVYKIVRNQLWDLGEAEHWRDVVQTEENKEGIDTAISNYGTTYLEGAETKVLRDAARESEEEALFDNNFNAFENVNDILDVDAVLNSASDTEGFVEDDSGELGEDFESTSFQE